MITFRPYQTTVMTNIRQPLARSKSVAIILPPGAGKTSIAAGVAEGVYKKGKTVMFCCHRDFLIEQTAETFSNVDLPYSYIAAGMPYNPYSKVQIASIDTLKRRKEKIRCPDLLFIDEAVHSAAAGWASVIEHYQAQGCFTIGLTGCPERTGGQGLGRWFKEMVVGPSTAELIDMGFLAKYKAFAPSRVDLTGLHSRGGDFVKEEVDSRMDKPSITGNAVAEYRKIAAGKQAVAFCCSIKHSQNVAQAFNDAGFRAVHIGADTDKIERKKMIADYRAGHIKVLTSVDIFNEGFNLPAVEYAALLRPTQSLSIYIQQIGRVLRTSPGKEFAYISDHANNIERHGLPDQPRSWTLESKEKKGGSGSEKSIPIRQCPQCYYVSKPSASCVNCGHVYEIKSRTVDEIDGELTEIDRDMVQARQEKDDKKKLYALIGIAKKRNIRNPESWAASILTKQMAQRRNKK